MTLINYPDKTSETYGYNQDGAVTQFIDRNTIPTNYVVDAEDRPTTITQAAGLTGQRVTYYKLDPLGNKTSMTDNKGQVTTFVYNEQSLVHSMADPMGRGYINTYDGAMNLISSKDHRGITRAMVYYRNNRLKSESFSDGTPSISYTYDGDGNRTGMTDGVGAKTYIYDPLNNLTSVTDSARNFIVGYTYDHVGNRLSEQNNKVSGSIQYSYYANNKLETVTDVDGMATTYAYDSMENPLSVSYPNGAVASYAYVPANHRLQSLENLTSHQEVLSSFFYGYDGVGNATTISDLTGAATFTYDNLYQLTNAAYPGNRGSVSYTYDGVGNRLSLNGVTGYSYDAGNAMTSGLGGTNVSVDLSGNMTSSGVTTYSWDGLNRLTKVVPSPSTAITYVYDGDNHRVQKLSSSVTINYFYDGNFEVAETDGNGNLLKSFTPGLSEKDQQGNKFFYLYNGHGDVAGLMDANQNLVQNYTYDAFGAALSVQNDPNNQRYVGTGGVYSDDDAGLQYMWNRWYNPGQGRFISRDPIGLRGGLNLYVYMGNNPNKGTDPTGLCGQSCGSTGPLPTNTNSTLADIELDLSFDVAGESLYAAAESGTGATLSVVLGTQIELYPFLAIGGVSFLTSSYIMSSIESEPVPTGPKPTYPQGVAYGSEPEATIYNYYGNGTNNIQAVPGIPTPVPGSGQ